MKLNIYNGTKLVVSEAAKTAITEKLSTQKRGLSLEIVISRATAEYLDTILEVIGDSYDEHLTMVNNNKMKFGMVKLVYSKIFSSRGTAPEEICEYQLLIYEPDYNSEALKEAITLEKPNYLIMNKTTWVNIAKDDDDTYDYNGKAVYHSFCQIPVALSEFFSNGEVDLVYEVK